VKAAKLTLGDARAIIAARLEHDNVVEGFRAPAPTMASIADFLTSYRDRQARLVTTTREAPWLGGSTRGWAIETLAPAQVLTLAGPGKIDTADGTFEVTPVGVATPLGLLPRGQAAPPATRRRDLKGARTQMKVLVTGARGQVGAARGPARAPRGKRPGPRAGRGVDPEVPRGSRLAV
jgi:hypothetical protein